MCQKRLQSAASKSALTQASGGRILFYMNLFERILRGEELAVALRAISSGTKLF